MSNDQTMPKQTNAMQRLLNVLSEMDRSNSTRPTAEVLASVIGAKVQDAHRSALLGYATFTKLIEAAETEALKHYEKEWNELVSPHLAGVRACFTPSSSGIPWNQRKANLTPADMTGLKHTAGHLMRHVHEIEVTTEEGKPLQEAISELEHVLQAGHISEYSRQVLQEKLDRLKAALAEYKLWGVTELRDAYRDLAGTLVTDPKVNKDLKQDRKKGGRTVTMVLLVISTVTQLMTFATQAHDVENDYLPLIEKHFLSPGRSSSPHKQKPQKRLSAPRPAIITATA